ncbi:MAG: tRNA-modifying protein YgfZ, partial [Verrucomicrobiota bacterium]
MAPLNPREGAFFDLSARVKLRLVGNDRLRFLNGQVTNNVTKADRASAIAACVLNAKGRMNAHLFFSAPPDSLWLDSAQELRESLKSRLERYIIADDVRIDELTDQFSLFHLLAQDAPPVPKECRIVSANRFGQRGFDLWVDVARREELFQQLRANM